MVSDRVENDAAEQALFDREATTLFREHHLGLLRFLLSLGTDRTLAEEIVNDAFLVAHRKWATVRTYDQPRAYVFKVATTLLCKHQPRRDKQLRELGTVPDIHMDDLCDGVLGEIDMLNLLSRLSERYRQVLLLDEIYGFEISAIADILNLSEGAVKRYGHNARKQLRNMLGGIGERGL